MCYLKNYNNLSSNPLTYDPVHLDFCTARTSKIPLALDNILGLYLGYGSLINSLDKHICLILSTRPPCMQDYSERVGFVVRVYCSLLTEHANICTTIHQKELCMADWRALSCVYSSVPVSSMTEADHK